MSNDSVLKTEKLSNLSLEEIVYHTHKVGLEYATAKQRSDRLDLLKATYRAKAMERYDDGKRPETKIRRLAEVDEQYVEFLTKFSELKSETERLRIRYESYKNLFEARRSSLSYQKAEMKLL